MLDLAVRLCYTYVAEVIDVSIHQAKRNACRVKSAFI